MGISLNHSAEAALLYGEISALIHEFRGAQTNSTSVAVLSRILRHARFGSMVKIRPQRLQRPRQVCRLATPRLLQSRHVDHQLC